jgi:Holliday junction resolvasome RuvABC endonuclease subunit|tara:strand:- start:335 stop:904 length:570 start_codon:yes stop_codon:yes gene_type:complete
MDGRRIGGIDYSLLCPAVTIYTGEKENFSFENCKSFFLSGVKKYEDYQYKNIEGSPQFKLWETPEERYDFISDWALDILISNEIENVAIEDYSYGSKGKVFHIAENTGLLKYKIWQADMKMSLIAPKAIKKFATGNGNANKELMYESFLKETSRNLQEELVVKSEKIGNPTSDIVDSYYICKMMLDSQE